MSVKNNTPESAKNKNGNQMQTNSEIPPEVIEATKQLRNALNSNGDGFVFYGWYEESDTVEIPILKVGSEGENVKALQILLIGNKCSCGKYGTDGKFGTATENAVMMYQDRNGLPVTGICDDGTWKKLLGL